MSEFKVCKDVVYQCTEVVASMDEAMPNALYYAENKRICGESLYTKEDAIRSFKQKFGKEKSKHSYGITSSITCSAIDDGSYDVKESPTLIEWVISLIKR